MRTFDARATFLEEGSTGLANAWRRRRITAVVLCRWHQVALQGSSIAVRPEVDARDGKTIASDEESELHVSDTEWELQSSAGLDDRTFQVEG